MTIGLSERLILRPLAELTSAFVESLGVALPPSARRIAMVVAYTSGAAGGFPSILVECSRDNVDWAPLGIANGSVTVLGVYQQTPLGVWEMQPFGTVGIDGTGVVSIPLVLPPCIYVRVQCKETGVVGAPGTLGITMDVDVELVP